MRNRFSLWMGLMLAAGAAMCPGAATATAKPPEVRVMTRNVYLGANLELGVRASSLRGLVDAAGAILRQVDENDFAIRAKGLAAEIRHKRPDLVGLQEAALWRTAPCTENPIPPKATQVRYDYLQLLLDNINRGGRSYRVAVAEPEFDFEIYANTDGDDTTSATGCPFGSEVNGRLTMRDVILVRTGVKISHARGGHFANLLQVRPAGVPIDVTRGWARVDARVPGGHAFRFVDTHLEAFDNQTSNHVNHGPDVSNGQIRAAQAAELVARGGPASGRLPVILVGDLNSDRQTAIKPGDAAADETLLHAGFAERSTSNPLGCCLNADVLTISGGGELGDFDHKVDHVMTDRAKQIKLVRSSLTGRRPANGFWDSDHAGLFSVLTLPPRRH